MSNLEHKLEIHNRDLHKLLKLNDEIIITEDYIKILKFIQDQDFDSNKVIFITGSAGSGKSTLLEIIKRLFKLFKNNAVFLSPTGISALNIGGQTIHSFFRIKPGLYLDDDEIYTNSYSKRIVENLDYLVIDEISMVRADLLDMIDKIMRRYKQRNLPFGGVKCIFFGDLMQLPPVLASNEEYVYLTKYDSPYFFDAKVFNSIDLHTFELNTVLRQTDEQFIKILQNLRMGNIIEDEIDYLNLKCFEEKKNYKNFGIYLANYNYVVNNYNKKKLGELPTKEEILLGVIKNDFPEDYFPVEYELKLKEGALVMLQVNSSNGDYVNGSVGTIKEISKDYLIIDINGNEVEVSKYRWDYVVYDIDIDGKIVQEVKGSYTQFPVKLAWAITIHKSQGKTLDKITIDFGRGSFAHGQTYVALSRCRSLNDIKFLRPLRQSDFIIDEKILSFIDNKYRITFKLR